MFKPIDITEEMKIKAENAFKSIYPNQSLSYDNNNKNYYINLPNSNEIIGPISLYELCIRMPNK